MTSRLLTGIGELVTADPDHGEGELGLRHDAALVVDDGRIAWVGAAAQAPVTDEATDVHGRCVLPGFVDSHTHLVFAGDRTAEFTARMSGEPYSAGGIATTVAATRAADDATLRAGLLRHVTEAMRQGTTTVEVKSGYGLTVAGEVTDDTTYLGAHVVPPEYAGRPDDYVSLVAGQMLAACAPYARFADVFCDRGAFDAAQARTVLTAAAAAGLQLRVHACQLAPGPGVQLAVELGAASADHCTHLTDADVDALAGSTTVATLLPGAEFSTRSSYPDARRLLDAGVTVALASDCNPGTSYTTSMPFCIALAVREMQMTPAEAVLAATRGGAAALRREGVGRLTPGAAADLVVLNASSFAHLAYRPGVPMVALVLNGGAAAVETGD